MPVHLDTVAMTTLTGRIARRKIEPLMSAFMSSNHGSIESQHGASPIDPCQDNMDPAFVFNAGVRVSQSGQGEEATESSMPNTIPVHGPVMEDCCLSL